MFYLCIQCTVNTCTALPFLIPLPTPIDLLISNQPSCYCHFFFFSFCVAWVQVGVTHVCSLLEWPHHITSRMLFHRSSPILQLYNLFFSFLWCPLGPWEGDKSCPVYGWDLTVFYSEPFDQLWVSAFNHHLLPTAAVLVWRDKQKHLKESVLPCLFSVILVLRLT